MKFKRIRTKMLVTILPPIIMAMVILAGVSLLACSKIVNEQITETMTASLDAEAEMIEESMQVVQSMAVTIANTVETTYQDMTLAQYEAMLAAIIADNDMVLGSGIWFEPYVYDGTQRYVGPYIYKDGNTIAVTYDYSNADYNYFEQEYYRNAKASAEPVITDPYYDATSNTIMSSCSMSIYDGSKYIGCVTVDMELSSIESVIGNIQIGDQGTAFLLSEGGTYLAGVDRQKSQDGLSILNDSNTSLAVAGKTIVSTVSGEDSYISDAGVKYNLYFDSIPSTGWHVVIQMPRSELLEPLFGLLYKLIIIAVFALILCFVLVLLQVSSIAKNIRQVQIFAQELASGDFTVDPLLVKSKDELGIMGNSLNDMYQGNRQVIGNISHHSAEIAGSSNQLKQSAGQLMESFERIQSDMSRINKAMMTASASTEEVNASVETLVAEARESLKVSQSIKERAGSVEESSRSSHQTAAQLTDQFEKRLNHSMENAKVVNNIDQMVRGIAGIAEQIHMLSLNASIEAARAGEQGKGFAVVAGQIGKLASETEELVKNIQNIIGAVQNAFQELSGDSNDLLGFIQNTVTPDYNQFVKTAEQYGEDAEFFASNADQIANILQEVKQAIQNIADAAQNTATTGSMVMISVEDVSRLVADVDNMSHRQQEIADQLDTVVKRFKLE